MKPSFPAAILSLLTASMASAQSLHVAYAVPAGTPGNQAFDGALGMDFVVNNAVNVVRLGCFDDDSNGLNRPIAVRLYDRDTLEVVAAAEFLPDDPSTPDREDGVLVDGSRFLPLSTPVNLPMGFRGTIVAEGYGAEERCGNRQPAPWTSQDGLGSLTFDGTSRYNWPVVPGAYPDSADGGPANRYAAGTFEYATTPPVRSAAPVVTSAPGNGAVDLAWAAVTAPLPAATYQILRSESLEGPFAQIAQVSQLSYRDSGLKKGQLYCYQVRGIGAGGQIGLDSATTAARPYQLGANQVIAYDTPWGVAGTQNFDGAVGMDFDVINPIVVRQLGCFDDNSDGLYTTLTVRLFNRDTAEEVASLTFEPDDPSTEEREDGTPLGGMRFKTLPSALAFPLGFHGVISVEGYNAMERLKNSFGLIPNISWTLGGGSGSIAFVGTSRFNYPVSFGAFPSTPDALPAQYSAGTFIYETTPPLVPGTPSARLATGPENHAVSLTWDPVLLPLPAARYHIFRAAAAEGPFSLVGETAQTYFRDANLPNDVNQFYLLRAIASGGQISADSRALQATPQARSGGIAYQVPADTFGNQVFGGALGMEFDVDRPVWITRLGVFDAASDGLQLPIAARLYNRDTAQVVASLTFDPDLPETPEREDGDLTGGSRFKFLGAPLALPAGFRGMIVTSGYGAAEPNGNVGSTNLGLSTFGGACLHFVGTSRYGLDPSGMATEPDGGPANRYAAGTFAFEPNLPPSGLAISLAPEGVRLVWSDPDGSLEATSDLANGPWELLPAAASGLVLPAAAPGRFFRLTR